MINHYRIYICWIIIASWLFLLAGCGDALIATQMPFRGIREQIKPGQTSREQVHTLLGQPIRAKVAWPAIDEGRFEVYQATGGSIGFITIIPIPTGEILHYALITYDTSGHVSDTDWNYNTYNTDAWNGVTLYAGSYGYHTGTNTIFPSKDSGGSADRKWASYLDSKGYYRTWGWSIDSRRRKWWEKDAFDSLCHAVERGHPAALGELGNYFRTGGLYDFDKDNVKACLWYSMANNKVVPNWCRDALTLDETAELEHLIEVWQPAQCQREIEAHMSGR